MQIISLSLALGSMSFPVSAYNDSLERLKADSMIATAMQMRFNAASVLMHEIIAHLDKLLAERESPGIQILFNAEIAALIFPLHAFYEGKLKRRIVKSK